MTKVFVHGNPETSVVWSALTEALEALGINDVVCVSPPGFGAPVPEDFGADPASYVDWLAAELETLAAPVDIVGHDWGAGHVFGLLAARSDLVRSWAADCAGLLHRDYVWHDMAQAWQTPGIGEQAVAAMTELPVRERTAMFAGLGIPEQVAAVLAAGVDAAMGRCVLKLYRASVQPAMSDLGRVLASASLPPGLVVDAPADAYSSPALGLEVASGLTAEVLTLAGQGHWWMLTAAEDAAVGLVDFWSGL